jgi:hypothetical protein
LLNPLQIYTVCAITQVIAREMLGNVDNLPHLLIKKAHFIGKLKISVKLRVYSILAASSN